MSLFKKIWNIFNKKVAVEKELKPIDLIEEKKEKEEPFFVSVELPKRKPTYCIKCNVEIPRYTKGNCMCVSCYQEIEERIKLPMQELYNNIFIYNKTTKIDEKIVLNQKIKEEITFIESFQIKWEIFGVSIDNVLKELDEEHLTLSNYVSNSHKRLTKELKENLKLKLKDKKPYEEYVVFDLETTGLHPSKGAEIIEIAALKVVNGIIVAEFEAMIKPKRKISKRITELTGITNKDVDEKPDVDEVLEEFYLFVGRYPLVAYNTPFDISFLQAYSDKFNKNKTDDALAIAKKKLKQDKKEYFLSSFKLVDVSDFFNYKLDNAHRALADVYATKHVYESLKDYQSYL